MRTTLQTIDLIMTITSSKYKIQVLIICLMTFFNLFQIKALGQKNFVTENEYKKNLSNQLKMTPQTLEQLKIYGVTEHSELKLEYFFYTNTIQKARDLAKQIEIFGYGVKFQKAVDDSKKYVITGWTSKMKMSKTNVLKWTKIMCDLGYEFDCDFDGWGTNPTQ